jgi:redox-regulated HSP33 family molecular chaperone
VVEIARADITSDIEQYYTMSEQLPTVLDLETYVNAEGHGSKHLHFCLLSEA